MNETAYRIQITTVDGGEYHTYRLGFVKRLALILLGKYLYSFEKPFVVKEIDDYTWQLTDRYTGEVYIAKFLTMKAEVAS